MGKDGRVKVNGIVTGKLLNVATMITYVHEDGRECPRPGPADLPLGAFVESEFQIEYGLCEHKILAVHDMAAEPEERSLTVADIFGAHSAGPDDVVSPVVSIRGVRRNSPRKLSVGRGSQFQFSISKKFFLVPRQPECEIAKGVTG